MGRGGRVGPEPDAEPHVEVEGEADHVVDEVVPGPVGLAADQEEQLVALEVGGGPQLERGPGEAPLHAVDHVDRRAAGPVVEQLVGVEAGDGDRVEPVEDSIERLPVCAAPLGVPLHDADRIPGGFALRRRCGLPLPAESKRAAANRDNGEQPAHGKRTPEHRHIPTDRADCDRKDRHEHDQTE